MSFNGKDTWWRWVGFYKFVLLKVVKDGGRASSRDPSSLG